MAVPGPSHLLYLHGFRSSPSSSKARQTAAHVAAHHPSVTFWCPQLPPSPRAAMALVVQGTFICASGILVEAILSFLGAWGQYLVPLIFSPTLTKPLTVQIPEFVTKNFIDYGLITASGTIASAL